jgi:serine/threonine-protein kinase RsbW
VTIDERAKRGRRDRSDASESTSNGGEEPARITRVTFQLPARLALRSLAIDLVSALVEHVPNADRDFRNAFVTAFGEAFNNVVIHGYRNRDDGILDVEAELGEKHMTLKLKDDGLQVDLSAVNPPLLDTLPEGGLGVFMIYALVDEVVYEGGKPNVLSLTKRTTTKGPDPSGESASK